MADPVPNGIEFDDVCVAGIRVPTSNRIRPTVRPLRMHMDIVGIHQPEVLPSALRAAQSEKTRDQSNRVSSKLDRAKRTTLV